MYDFSSVRDLAPSSGINACNPQDVEEVARRRRVGGRDDDESIRLRQHSEMPSAA